MDTLLLNENNALREQVSSLQSALAAAQSEIGLLRQKLDALARRLFGVSSEALNPAQLQLLLQLPELAVEPVINPPVPQAVEKRQPVRKARSPRLPEHLPVVEEVIEPEPVKAAPQDWRCIGQEISEQLDFEPSRFLRRWIIRKKYVHRTEVDAVLVIASLPERLLAGACPRRDCWRTFGSANTATICRCIGRNRFTRNDTRFIYPGKRWPAGWSWRRIGCSPFTNKSAPG